MLIHLLALTFLVSDVTLSGVVVSRSGRHAATLSSDGRVRLVVAGDRAFGCEVKSILEGSVELSCDGVSRKLHLVAAPTPRRTLDATTEPAEADDPHEGISVSRADLESRLDREMSRLITETTLIPVTSRGQVAGFSISRIPQGTILETIGLKAGDVLVSVNETPIDSFTTLVGLWPRLQASGSVKARVLRDGKPLDISVSIR